MTDEKCDAKLFELLLREYNIVSQFRQKCLQMKIEIVFQHELYIIMSCVISTHPGMRHAFFAAAILRCFYFEGTQLAVSFLLGTTFETLLDLHQLPV